MILDIFRCPKDDKIRQKWINALQLNESVLPKDFFICSDHFLASEYFYEGSRLNKNSVPALFLKYDESATHRLESFVKNNFTIGDLSVNDSAGFSEQVFF